MPLIRDRCNCCNNQKIKCPECDSTFVTPCEGMKKPSPKDLVYFSDKDEITYTHYCWDCGWKEKVTVTIERN